MPEVPDGDLSIVEGPAVGGLGDRDLGLVVAEEDNLVGAFIRIVAGDGQGRRLRAGGLRVELDLEIRAAVGKDGRRRRGKVKIILGIVRDIDRTDVQIGVAEVIDGQGLGRGLADGAAKEGLSAVGDVDRFVADIDLRERRHGHEPEAPVVVEVLADDGAGGVLNVLEPVLRVPVVEVAVIRCEEVPA